MYAAHIPDYPLVVTAPLLQNKDTLQDLRASVHYYEHVAESKGDATRQDAISRTAKKLKNILATVVGRVDG